MTALPASEREWLINHLGVSPRPPFIVALRAILDKHGDSLDPLIGGHRDRFVDEVVGTLEYILGRQPDLEAAAASGAALYWLNEKLRFLLKACFLQEAGFSAEAILRFFQRNVMYQHIHHQVAAQEASTAG